MTKRDAIRLKARIERETGDGPADVRLDTRGSHQTWMVTFGGRQYHEPGQWTEAD